MIYHIDNPWFISFSAYCCWNKYLSSLAQKQTPSRNFKQNFRICSWRRWDLKCCRMLCLLPYPPRQAKQRLASEFSSVPVLFSHFLSFQTKACKSYLRHWAVQFKLLRINWLQNLEWRQARLFSFIFLLRNSYAQKVGFGVYSLKKRPWISSVTSRSKTGK